MWRWLRFLLFVFPFFATGTASAQIDTMAAVHGSCEIFIVAGIQTPCPPKGVMYSHLTNGRVLLSVALPNEQILSFVGEKDSQPRPEEYWLYLSRVRIGSRATEIVAQVAGQCIVHMTRDGTAWFRLDCDATDEQDRAYRLHFEADGRPIDVVHPSDTADAQAAPPTATPTSPIAAPTPTGSSTGVGPSFDCAAVRTPAAQLICSSPDMSRLDLMFVQAYYAMRQQVGEAGWQTLKVEAVNFEDQTLQRCGIPLTGILPPDPRPWIACLAAAYERQRAVWLSRLSGPGGQEARRPIEEHVALQRDLQVIGLLPASETIDGVYGSASRTAILAWQQSQGTEPTGFLSDADAARLERQIALAQPSGVPSSSRMSGALTGKPETIDVPASTPNAPTSQSPSLEIALERDGGTLVVPISINDAITLKFVVDSGASDVNIPADVVRTLMRAGTIDEADFLGRKTYRLADGSTVPSETFRIRVLKVGDLEIDNVTASIGDVNGTLLLGQSFLRRFRSWSIDNQRQVLVLNQ